jgi:anti-anti-sigma regulatory factor
MTRSGVSSHSPASSASQSRPAERDVVVRTRRSLETYRIELSGELTRTRVPALVQALETALDRGAAEVVLDLSHVERIDRACVHTILVAHLRASDQLQQLVIVPGSSSVRAALEGVEGPFQYADA